MPQYLDDYGIPLAVDPNVAAAAAMPVTPEQIAQSRAMSGVTLPREEQPDYPSGARDFSDPRSSYGADFGTPQLDQAAAEANQDTSGAQAAIGAKYTGGGDFDAGPMPALATPVPPPTFEKPPEDLMVDLEEGVQPPTSSPSTTPAARQEQPWDPYRASKPTPAQAYIQQNPGTLQNQSVYQRAMEDRKRQIFGYRPQQQQQQAQQQPDDEDWLTPIGEFAPTYAQRQMEKVVREGGRISNDIYDAAVRDRRAQERGMPYDPMPGRAEATALWQYANTTVRMTPGPHREAAVNTLFQHMMAETYRSRQEDLRLTETAKRQKIAQEAQDKRDKEHQAQSALLQLSLQRLKVLEAMRHEGAMSTEKQRSEGVAQDAAKTKADVAAGRAAKTAGLLTQKQEIDILHRHQKDIEKEWNGMENADATDIPTAMLTEEGRRQLAEERAERDIMPFRVDPQAEKDFDAFAKGLPRVEGEEGAPRPFDLGKMNMEQLYDLGSWMAQGHKIRMPKRKAADMQKQSFAEMQRRFMQEVAPQPAMPPPAALPNIPEPPQFIMPPMML